MKQPILYSALFCPFSRYAVLGLKEKNVPFQSRLEQQWRLSDAVQKLTPFGTVPILHHGTTVCANYWIISAYLDHAYSDVSLLGATVHDTVRIKHVVMWFEKIFYSAIYKTIFYERALKGAHGHGAPSPERLRHAMVDLQKKMVIIDHLCARDAFLVGNTMTWADIAASVHLSCVDYIVTIPWDSVPFAKRWYMKIKSRPTFRSFLQERVSNIEPSKNYPILDF